MGAGGMGTVYEATDDRLGRPVALKVLHPAASGAEEGGRSPILREARLGARVEQDRIARVYDVGEHEGRLFVAMEFVRGETLRRLMSRGRMGPMGALYVVKLAIEIAEGLAELHAHGVVHRDLKPENVMLRDDGGIKLVDFGLARHMDRDQGAAVPGAGWGSGESTAFAGTLGYMAPERLAGGPLHPRADVFALGVIVYELMTGSRPFAGHRPLDFLKAATSPVRFDAKVWREDRGIAHHDVSPALREATACMLSRDPQRRFADGAAALRALAGCRVRLRRATPPAHPRGARRRDPVGGRRAEQQPAGDPGLRRGRLAGVDSHEHEGGAPMPLPGRWSPAGRRGRPSLPGRHLGHGAERGGAGGARLARADAQAG
ncbi:MAG: serine/threonine protein kinase, partial [Myxococcales bacterium]|nr:serine/threonine protein kinase [Myxococcales bacterium]